MDEPKKTFSILWIGSDQATLSRVKQSFADHPKFPAEFDRSQTLSEVVEKINRNRYHLILADESSENGLDLGQVLGEINRKKIKTPFVLLTNRGQSAQVNRALKAGATDYVVKNEEGFQTLAERLWSIWRNYELTPGQGGLGEQIAEDSQKLMEVNERFRQLSIRDELTRLYNHRYFQERLVEEFTRAVRHSYPISCLLLDIDLFRRINDKLGHAPGDAILKEAAGILSETCRLSDLIGRFGGEEFSILLPHVDYQGAIELGERLREIFVEHTFLVESHQVSLTVSVGISCYPDDSIQHRNILINYPHQALFRAKVAGRNRVFLYRDIVPLITESLPHLKISEEKVLEFQKKLSAIADAARRGYMQSSKALIAALESKDRFTAGHAGNVARLSLQVAEAMGMSLDEAEIVEHAGLLHDIGKICISDEILLKSCRFDHAEYEAMKQHPYFGYRIVKPIKFLQEEATLILHHHEWFNGEGYPCRLAKNGIPLGSRIISVVDSYDTMRIAGGRYKKTMSVEEAVNELIHCAGKQFDPEVVQAFIQVLMMRKELGEGAYDRKYLQQALEANSPQ